VAFKFWATTCFCCVVVSSALAQSVNFSICLEEVRGGQWGTIGGTDNSGHPVSNISEATAITYDLCLRACGSGSERFNWNIFSQQFTYVIFSPETGQLMNVCRAWLLRALSLRPDNIFE
jgi:hypothetical protein